MKALYYRSK